MCVWGNGAQRGYKKSQHQLVVARGLCLGMLARLAGGGGGARQGRARGQNEQVCYLARRREEVDSHSFGANWNYEQSLGVAPSFSSISRMLCD